MLLDIDNQPLTLDLLVADRQFRRLRGDCTEQDWFAFLDSASRWLESLGVAGVTRSIAWQVWWVVYERIEQLRVRSELEAEIAFWFHVDPSKLSAEQKVGMIANLDRCKAQQRLNIGNFDGADWETVYRLVLMATGDRAQAEKAKGDAMERYVDAKMGATK